MNALGNTAKQELGRRANNRVENSHLPFRRRERAMLRFWQMKTLQQFASVQTSLHTFSSERHFVDRQTYKERRSAARSSPAPVCNAWVTLAAVRCSRCSR